MTQYGFYFDSSRCTGCHTCEIACKDYHDLTQLETFRRVYDCEGGTTQGASDDTVASTAFAYHVSAACNHCANPGCIAATGNDGTIVKDDETGLVLIVDAAGVADPQAVVEACPYGVPVIDSRTGLLEKCDGCHDRVRAGKRPICVEACPLRALDFGDIATLGATHPGCARQVTPLPDASLTDPNLLVLPSEAAVRAAGSGGVISNPREITNDAQDT